ncbi:hypothetical protein [Micavibrio aeruginosavorus]|uniref:Uncharacterized protein n=1 Tax=Micavibrio aeruginosavorus (strain ARL-13) TaxID=856793 RepID=G2KQ84_MICAA|nr:hypothetical protein [Micavibrio aeruginosavorus]AEP08626.1 hypothetical protein MICA_281 [Micavibrio aeruginosavorus ARL-13]
MSKERKDGKKPRKKVLKPQQKKKRSAKTKPDNKIINDQFGVNPSMINGDAQDGELITDQNGEQKLILPKPTFPSAEEAKAEKLRRQKNKKRMKKPELNLVYGKNPGSTGLSPFEMLLIRIIKTSKHSEPNKQEWDRFREALYAIYGDTNLNAKKPSRAEREYTYDELFRIGRTARMKKPINPVIKDIAQKRIEASGLKPHQAKARLGTIERGLRKAFKAEETFFKNPLFISMFFPPSDEEINAMSAKERSAYMGQQLAYQQLEERIAQNLDAFNTLIAKDHAS